MNKPFNDSCNSHDPWGRRSRKGLEYVGNHPGDELDVLVVDHLYPFLIDLLMAEWVAKSTAKSRGNQPPFWWKTFKKNTWGTVAQSEWKYWCEPPLSSAAVWRTNPLFFFGYVAPKEGLNSRKFFLDFNSDWLDTFQRKTEICWRLLCLHDESNCCSSFCSVTWKHWKNICSIILHNFFCKNMSVTCETHV